jgi:ribosomal protein S18 acetylase RimI-like enzyme
VLANTEEGREVLESAVTIVYIHTLTLKKEFRGKGIGLKTMKFVIDQFTSGLNLILLHPAPLGMCVGEEGHDRAIKKLEDHWSKVGFRRLGSSDVYYLPF